MDGEGEGNKDCYAYTRGFSRPPPFHTQALTHTTHILLPRTASKYTYDARIALCDAWKSRLSFVLDWITLSRAWRATKARRSSRLAVLRPSDEKERRRRPDIDITYLHVEKRGGGGQRPTAVRHSYGVRQHGVGQRRGRRHRVRVMRAGKGTQHRTSVVPGSTVYGGAVVTSRPRERCPGYVDPPHGGVRRDVAECIMM